jgi:hypothetical protein
MKKGLMSIWKRLFPITAAAAVKNLMGKLYQRQGREQFSIEYFTSLGVFLNCIHGDVKMAAAAA